MSLRRPTSRRKTPRTSASTGRCRSARPMPKSIETKHYAERAELFDGLKRLDRRGFMRLASLSAGLAAAKGLVTPQSFQLISVADAAQPRPKFTIAYIS